MRRRSHHKSAFRFGQHARVRRQAGAGRNVRPPTSYRRGALGQRDERLPFSPPEDWHEPTGANKEYRVIEQTPGPGYRHVLTEEQIRSRLAELPNNFVEPLEVVQLSRMTRKKQSFPCYGMQWGAALYLYPIEESYVEVFDRPPQPTFYNEVRMYGGHWEQNQNYWQLVWTPRAIEDFYLNNILIHELGHLLDERNSNYGDRERYAEWFAIEYGYRRSGGRKSRGRKSVRRRHHGS